MIKKYKPKLTLDALINKKIRGGYKNSRLRFFISQRGRYIKNMHWKHRLRLVSKNMKWSVVRKNMFLQFRKSNKRLNWRFYYKNSFLFRRILKQFYGYNKDYVLRNIYLSIYKKRLKFKTDAFLGAFEQRADMIMFRLGFLPTVHCAREFILNNGITINEKIIKNFGQRLKIGDIIGIQEQFWYIFYNKFSAKIYNRLMAKKIIKKRLYKARKNRIRFITSFILSQNLIGTLKYKSNYKPNRNKYYLQFFKKVTFFNLLNFKKKNFLVFQKKTKNFSYLLKNKKYKQLYFYNYKNTGLSIMFKKIQEKQNFLLRSYLVNLIKYLMKIQNKTGLKKIFLKNLISIYNLTLQSDRVLNSSKFNLFSWKDLNILLFKKIHKLFNLEIEYSKLFNLIETGKRDKNFSLKYFFFLENYLAKLLLTKVCNDKYSYIKNKKAFLFQHKIQQKNYKGINDQELDLFDQRKYNYFLTKTSKNIIFKDSIFNEMFETQYLNYKFNKKKCIKHRFPIKNKLWIPKYIEFDFNTLRAGIIKHPNYKDIHYTFMKSTELKKLTSFFKTRGY